MDPPFTWSTSSGLVVFATEEGQKKAVETMNEATRCILSTATVGPVGDILHIEPTNFIFFVHF